MSLKLRRFAGHNRWKNSKRWAAQQERENKHFYILGYETWPKGWGNRPEDLLVIHYSTEEREESE